MDKIFTYQLKYQIRIIILVTVCAMTILGLLSMLLNRDSVIEGMRAASLPVITAYFAIPFLAVFLEFFYSLIFAIAAYFFVAAVGQGFRFVSFFGLACRVMVSLPMIQLADLAGIIICGEKFTELGFVGIISYIPFYMLIFFNTYFLIPHIVKINIRQQKIITTMLTLLMILVSYPYN